MNHQSFPLEIKSLTENGTFAGYASVFDVVDSQRDVMRRGAFAVTLKGRKTPVQLLWQHQWDSPIGVLAQIFEDKHGLYVEGRLLLGVAKAREAYALLKAGALKGLSIGFTVQKACTNPDTGARELLAVNLFEVSLVTLPANEVATVTVVKAVSGLDKAERALVGMVHTLMRNGSMPRGWEKTKRIADAFFTKAAAGADSETWDGEDDGDFDDDDIAPGDTLPHHNVPNPVSKIVPNMVNIFIGGADDREGLFGNHPVLRSGSLRNGVYGRNYYAMHTDTDKINQQIGSIPQGTTINLIGHSWGADTAAHVALNQENSGRINMLVTIDPVSTINPIPNFATLRDSVGTWVNVNALGNPNGSLLDDIFNGNLVAASGDWGAAPENYADIFIAAPLDHAAFDAMMNRMGEDGKSPQRILNED